MNETPHHPPRVFIAAVHRSPVGRYLGGLAPLAPRDLMAQVIRGTLESVGLPPEAVDSAIVGNVLAAGHGHNIARQSILAAGLPRETPAHTINMVCGSGLKAIMQATADIRAGDAHVVLAGGVESMSQAAYVAPASIRSGVRMGDLALRDTLLADGLQDAIGGYHMGITAENVAEKYGITRGRQDAFALESQRRARVAIEAGVFDDEILPVTVPGRKGETVVERDEHPNSDSTAEKLASLRPVFKEGGTVTAGNASGINDGAALAVVVSEEAASRWGLSPLVEVVGYAQHGVSPEVMGLGPTGAVRKVLDRTGVGLSEVDVVELNEAFAAQSLGVVQELSREHGVGEEWLLERTNVHGGAIALGHALGASGARITATLAHEMRRSDERYGMAALCIGGGMGVAALFRKV